MAVVDVKKYRISDELREIVEDKFSREVIEDIRDIDNMTKLKDIPNPADELRKVSFIVMNAAILFMITVLMMVSTYSGDAGMIAISAVVCFIISISSISTIVRALIYSRLYSMYDKKIRQIAIDRPESLQLTKKLSMSYWACERHIRNRFVIDDEVAQSLLDTKATSFKLDSRDPNNLIPGSDMLFIKMAYHAIEGTNMEMYLHLDIDKMCMNLCVRTK